MTPFRCAILIVAVFSLVAPCGALARGKDRAISVAKVFGPEHPGGKYKHPASIAQLDNGDLYLTFYGGSGEYATDTAVYGARRSVGDRQWSEPVVVADTPFVSEGNPVVWQAPDGVVWLFYVVRYGATWSTSRIQAKISRDGARSWSDPTILAFDEGMMVRGRPIVLDDGDYLAPIYHETGHDTEVVGADSTSLFLRYDVETQKWSPTGRIRSPRGNIQPAVAQLDADRLVAFCRRCGGYGPDSSGFIVRSESRDGGQTWSEGRDTLFPNPNAAVELLRLQSGNLLLVYNDSMTERDPLVAALSTDGGQTFEHRLVVAAGGTQDFAYPYAIQAQDGKIHLIFTSDGRAIVNHAVFSEHDLTGTTASKKTNLDASQRNVAPRNVKVFGEPGRFGGWPANHGVWSWGDEILVGFGVGYHKDLGPTRHAIDRDRPEEHVLARSLDGGETWSLEYPGRKGMLVGSRGLRHGAVPPDQREPAPTDFQGGVDFTHPDFAMTVRMADKDTGESRFYVSTDRGRVWAGPFRLPLFGQPGIMARTDYIVNGPHDCLLFLTAEKSNSGEGRPICVRTRDGGVSWKLESMIGPEPKGYAIMPSTVRLEGKELLTSIRCREGDASWIDLYRSQNDGQSWEFAGKPVPDTGEGNPPSMIRLADGTLCLTYGYRAAPFGIRARLSRDGGKTWAPEIVLRDDGGGRDVGYPRSVQRRDGKIVTIYYYHDTLLGNRYIAATIWEPPL